MNFPFQRNALAMASVLFLLQQAQAQNSAAPATTVTLEEVTVTVSRTSTDVASTARSVTIFNQQTIERELATKPDLGALLSTVPGIGMSVEGRSNATGQDMIRGRRIQVLVDGVAQDQPFLDFRQDFQNISLDSVERIEVLRGGSALYGLGATGGIVNIISKQPQPGPFRAGVLLNLGPHSGSGRAGFDLSGSVSSLSYRIGYTEEKRGVRKDSSGHDIPTANLTSDLTRSKNLDIKLSLQTDVDGRLAFSANHYSIVETGRLLAVGGNALTGVRASAVPFPIGVNDAAVNTRVGGVDQPAPYREVNNYSLSYERTNVWGSDLSMTAYQMSRTEETATLLFNRYVQPVGNSTAQVAPNLRLFGQNLPENQRRGLRTTVETPLSSLGLPAGAKVVWGADFDRQSYIQPNNARGVPGFTVSNSSPDIAQKSAAGFAQVDAKFGAVNLSGGLRYESVDVEIPSFVVSNSFGTNRGNAVTGGVINFNKTLGNIGAVWSIDPAFRPFASYGQSFALGEILRAVRSTAAKSIVTSTELQPQVVDTFEIGARGRLGDKGTLAYTVAAFQARSPLGATFVYDPVTLQTAVERAPEKTHGFEATLDYTGIKDWKLGGTLAIQEGFRTINGVERRLPGTRIAPTKIYAYADWNFAAGWNTRLDVVHGRGRNHFAANTTATGEGRVEPLTLANLAVAYDGKQWGKLSLGISNLFNKSYVPQPLQALNQSDRYYAGEGRAFRLTYRNSF